MRGRVQTFDWLFSARSSLQPWFSSSSCLKTLVSCLLRLVLSDHIWNTGASFSLFLSLLFPAGLAAEVQPSGRLRGQVLLLPHVPRCGLHGVEAVLRPGSSEQVRRSEPLVSAVCRLVQLPPAVAR